MKITNFNLAPQRNAGHYQFLTDFNSCIIKFTPHALDVEVLYNAFLLTLNDESVALNAITKSATTEDIDAYDKKRDFSFRGVSNMAKNSLNHFNADVREAAKKAMVIFDGYGNLVAKPNDEESGLITSLIADLRSKEPAALIKLGLEDWIAELERLNNTFIALVATRNSEEASRTELRMKKVRIEADNAYKAIVERVNALIVINGETNYVEFAKEVNARIARAKDSIAQSLAERKPIVVNEV